MKPISMKAKKWIEAGAVVSAAAVLFVITRKLGVQQRGNTLWGGEICVPFLVIGGWYAVKSIIRDVKSGLFRTEDGDE
jgi:hypothetical protein